MHLNISVNYNVKEQKSEITSSIDDVLEENKIRTMIQDILEEDERNIINNIVNNVITKFKNKIKNNTQHDIINEIECEIKHKLLAIYKENLNFKNINSENTTIILEFID